MNKNKISVLALFFVGIVFVAFRPFNTNVPFANVHEVIPY